MIEQLFFELIRVAIGSQNTLSRPPLGVEWKQLYDMAKKQSLVGVCFAGVQKTLSNSPLKGEDPSIIGMPEMLYLTWMGMAAKIQQRNEIINKQCIKLQTRLAKDEFRSCILKGQGVAQLYTEDLCGLRQSGDIDIWVEGGFDKVNAWVQNTAPSKEINQHHIHFDIFNDTDVELHYYPFNLTSPLKNRILRKFFKKQEEICFTNERSFGFCVPTSEFNLVFLMVHIFHHLFTEGVGLRQLMDYYFVLRSLFDNTSTSLAQVDKDNAFHIIEKLGMLRFAQALMYVLQSQFGLEEKYLLCEADPEGGAFLFEEIMQSGNFGKYDERQKRLFDSKWNSFWMVHGKTLRFWRFDHWAWFWSPIHRIKSKIWQYINGYK